jgi:2-dehydro-3-deoxyphosphogluconate aldolase/(4S)-4-hydroxy-2-oxoglutarate aldolase
MARLDRLSVLGAILDTGLVPIFYNADADRARRAVSACAEGGARAVEFTNRGDGAWRVFEALVEFVGREHPSVALGVGTVLDPETAALYTNIGADFAVSPILNPEVVRLCNRRRIACIPGCGSASEISQAEELGVEIVKLFPGATLGPEFLRAVLGPMPRTRVMPTNGVGTTEEGLRGWFEAGAACVGLGADLVRRQWLETEDWGALREAVSEVLGTIRRIRCGA